MVHFLLPGAQRPPFLPGGELAAQTAWQLPGHLSQTCRRTERRGQPAPAHTESVHTVGRPTRGWCSWVSDEQGRAKALLLVLRSRHHGLPLGESLEAQERALAVHLSLEVRPPQALSFPIKPLPPQAAREQKPV